MMPRRKKRNLIIALFVIVVLIIISIFVVLYMLTDSFKSNDILFTKYISQNFTQINELKTDEIYNEAKEEIQILEENKYDSKITGKITHSDTNNKMNNLSLNIDSKNDSNSLYTSKDVKITNGEKDVVGFEYLNIENNPSIRLKGIKQFVGMKYGELIDLNENFKNIDLNTFKIKEDIYEVLAFSKDELDILKNRYIGVINQNTSSKNYSKQTKAVITINGKQVSTNAYTIKMSKEKMNNLYIKILEKLKEDEIILEKIDKIEKKLVENNFEVNKLKEKFIQKIETKIQDIESNNIGQEEKKITVYESDERTLRTTIETENGAIYIDFIDDNSGKIIEIRNIKNTEKENSKLYRIKKDEQTNGIIINIDTVEDGQEKNIELNIETEENNQTLSNDISLKLYNKETYAMVNLKEDLNIVQELTNIKQISEDDKVDLAEKDKEDVLRIKEKLRSEIEKQIQELQTIVSKEDINNILVELNFLKEQAEPINEEEVTEAQKNRFNSYFELFEGEEISKEEVKQLIEVTKDHLKNAQIAEYKETKKSTDPKIPKKYKLTIEKDNKNEQLANKLITQIEEEKEKSYKIEFEHDENTGVINTIWITLNEKK